MSHDLTKLTKTDLDAIERRIEYETAALPEPRSFDDLLADELAAIGEPPDYDTRLAQAARGLGSMPTLDQLKNEGHTDNRMLTGVLDFIAGTGRVITLLIAEAIQSGAALIIGVVFAILEYWRVYHGAEALGQPHEQAALIAVAVVVANVVHPIYRLRELRGKPYHETTRITGRGAVMAFWDRLTGAPVVERREWSHNPVLDMAAIVITLTTIFLAVYDLIAPILTAIIEGTASRPGLILAIELLMGLGLSLAGVFFLQAAAHEIGVRVITDQPVRLADELDRRKSDYMSKRQAITERVAAETEAARQAHTAATVEARQRAQDEARAQQASYYDEMRRIRESITAEYMAGKLADQQRKQATGENFTMAAPVTLKPISNGNGRNGHDHAQG